MQFLLATVSPVGSSSLPLLPAFYTQRPPLGACEPPHFPTPDTHGIPSDVPGK